MRADLSNLTLEERKAHKRAYQKAWFARNPGYGKKYYHEVKKVRNPTYQIDRYHNDPEKRQRELARVKAYQARPGIREKLRKARKIWWNSAEGQAYLRKYKGQPEPTRKCPKRCECCGGKPNGIGRLHLDHDHATGKFRGWICYSCNMGIGLLGDTLDSLRKAVNYLRRSK